MTNEQLFELVESHFTNEYLKEVHFDFTNKSIKLLVVSPVTVEHIKFDSVLSDKQINQSVSYWDDPEKYPYFVGN